MAMAAQHREVAALRDQMAMLMHEMTAMRQGSMQSTVLQSLQQVLRALINLILVYVCQPSLSLLNNNHQVQSRRLAPDLRMP